MHRSIGLQIRNVHMVEGFRAYNLHGGHLLAFHQLSPLFALEPASRNQDLHLGKQALRVLTVAFVIRRPWKI